VKKSLDNTFIMLYICRVNKTKQNKTNKMRNAINNQMEVIADIEAALTVTDSIDKRITLRIAKIEAIKLLTTLKSL